MNWQTLVSLLGGYGKAALQVSALLLSIINGLMLLRFYFRDRAKLTVHPIHPEVYQWWFPLPPGEFEGSATRSYGFIAYMAIQNSGLRKTQLASWRLSIRTGLGKSQKLKPINMPEPSFNIGGHVKLYPVLGQQGLHLPGDTVVDAGCSTSGMVYYTYECYGGQGWDPEMTREQIDAEFQVTDGFERRAKCVVRFKRKSLEEIQSFAPGIDSIRR